MEQIFFVTKPTEKARKIENNLRQLLDTSGIHLEKPLIIAVGGDGTMLQAIKDHLHSNVMFVGIAAGWLGYLQTVNPDEIDLLVKSLRHGEYGVVEAPLLVARDAASEQILTYAFNDISLERAGARAAKFALRVGDSEGKFVGDGVLFTTPLGSTAYGMAAGGPIIDASARDVFAVVPNNPHVSVLYSSLQRPHILSSRRSVRLSFDTEEVVERPLKLIGDGIEVETDFTHDIEIALSDRHIDLLELTQDGWYNHIDAKRLGRN
ncbi:NAD(+)/NADH kinase [bacterium]|nr:NAD(+)/NADH kinase [bacterium]